MPSVAVLTQVQVDSNVAELSLAIQVCREGVPRTHLINAYTDGALFLELYTRDGLGTMVSKDLYEGMRPAAISDLDQLVRLLRPMEKVGTLIERSEEEVRVNIENFTVIEREGRLIGCSLLKDIGDHIGEISAFVVQEEFRTEHRGDALLDFVEQRARNSGFKMLALLTTRTGDWFSARGFENKGAAHAAHGVLPRERISLVNPKRDSMLLCQYLWDFRNSLHRQILTIFLKTAVDELCIALQGDDAAHGGVSHFFYRTIMLVNGPFLGALH